MYSFHPWGSLETKPIESNVLFCLTEEKMKCDGGKVIDKMSLYIITFLKILS